MAMEIMAEALAHSMVVLSGMRILNFLHGTFDIQKILVNNLIIPFEFFI